MASGAGAAACVRAGVWTHATGARLGRRLVEVDDDRVAIGADVMRDRLRQSHANARAAFADRIGGLDGHAFDRAFGREQRSW